LTRGPPEPAYRKANNNGKNCDSSQDIKEKIAVFLDKSFQVLFIPYCFVLVHALLENSGFIWIQ
jgi:hypothetical protein